MTLGVDKKKNPDFSLLYIEECSEFALEREGHVCSTFLEPILACYVYIFGLVYHIATIITDYPVEALMFRHWTRKLLSSLSYI